MKLDPDNLKGTSKIYKEIAPYIGLGMQLAVTVTIMVFVGLWLDDIFDTEPVLIIVCSIFGVFAGLYTFIRQVLKSGK
jgi:ATP synthase protein I